MIDVSAFDRDEERDLLADWLDTTSFAPEPAGLPTLAPDPDEDDDEAA